MSYSPVGDAFAEGTQLSIDANASTVTQALDMAKAKDVSFQVIANSGAHANHVLTLQVSMDETNWFTTSLKVTGTGVTTSSFFNIARFARLKVTTLEGAASTVDVTIQAK